ncbi:putative reverse transcriptase domain-containing protein [Tanacetum coccineum]
MKSIEIALGGAGSDRFGGGGESLVCRCLKKDGSLAMLTVDFSNAFNLVDRTTLLHEVRTRCPSISLWVDFLYGQSARLYVGDDYIWSTTGVQQGDPLGPLLFALVLHPLVHRIRDCCQLLFHAWYLDDGTIIGDTKEVKEGLFPRDIGRPTLGVKLFGGAVSRDAGFISSLAVKRASRAVKLMSLLPSLRDPQSELLFATNHAWASQSCCLAIVFVGSFFGDFQMEASITSKLVGWVGLCSAEDVLPCFVASRAQSWNLQDHILQGCGTVLTMDMHWIVCALVECLRVSPVSEFLDRYPPLKTRPTYVGLEYRLSLSTALFDPSVSGYEPLPVCRKVVWILFGEHEVHEGVTRFKYRHDLVRDVLYDVLKRAGISSRKEAPVNFLTDPLEGRSTLRPADILVFGWAGGKHACLILLECPLVGSRAQWFVAGQAALKAESSKVAKHEKACLENQHVFIPFAFDTFGFLAPEAEEFLNRVQRVMQSNFSTLKTQNFIFSRIGFAIQKEVAAQLVARLPAILL